MNRQIIVGFHTALIVLASVVASSFLTPEAFSQSKSTGLDQAMDPSLPPQLVEEYLRLSALEKQMELLFDQGITSGEKFDALVASFTDRHERIRAIQKKLEEETEQNVGSSAEKVNRSFQTINQANEEQAAALMAKLAAEKTDMLRHLKRLETELGQAHRELAIARQKAAKSQPDDKRNVSVFQLKYAQANEAAKTLENLLGDVMRLSVDSRTNTLIVQAGEDQIKSIHDLLSTIDQPSEENTFVSLTNGEKGLPAAMMVRTFWLCDGQPADGAKPADSVLPVSVCEALGKIGFSEPFLVSQATTSVALEDLRDRMEGRFEIHDVPAYLFGNLIDLNMQGRATAHESGLLKLWVEFAGQKDMGGNNFRNLNVFQGSVVTPLDHYVVLGTTGYATGGKRSTASSRGGGRGGGEMAIEESPEDEPKLSQLAYVVQVVAAETFGAEDKRPSRTMGRGMENNPPRAVSGQSQR